MSSGPQTGLIHEPDDRPDWRSEPLPRSQRRRALALSCSAAFLFYVLSAGPLSGLARIFKVPGFQRVLEIVYAPLALIIKVRIEPFASALRWYAELFR